MKEINIPPVLQEGFKADAELNGIRLAVRFSGTGDMAAVAHLERCLRDVHEEVARQGLSTVDIDIQALYLLNSSCLKALMAFIHTIQTDGPRYEVNFVTDPHLTWQPRCLRVIQRLAPDVVSVNAAPEKTEPPL